MKYAVVKLSGKQYRIKEGEDLLIDKVVKDLTYDVLMLNDEGKVSVGTPKLDDVKIDFKILESDLKGEKIDVYKYKSKSRYRKKIGFRPHFTKLHVEKING
jgi:large subunit ribosomal protein L21